jgi:EAL and modified HD-GYP domain-containing signal transduction protein
MGGMKMFIARQPIFDQALKVYGYELLFRSDKDAKTFGNATATTATATVLGGLFETGINQIVDGKKAFINFDYEFLLLDTIELIDPESLVIEVLENVKVDNILLNRLQQLKNQGYKIALDDFVEAYDSYPIVPMADIIKYDIMETPLDTIEAEVKRGLKEKKILLAEKIETQEEFLKAKEMGFILYQGYFFSKPSIIGKSNDKKSTKAQYARLITELGKPSPSYQALAEIIETDVNLAYRLMTVISHRPQDDLIYTIKKALIYMGFKEIERWINILMLQNLSTSEPKELVKLSLVRAKFSEYISENSSFKKRKIEVSMMCLFSTIDAILDQTMEEALSGISLTEDIKEALINESGTLRPVYELVRAYESGNWDKVNIFSMALNVDQSKLYAGYLKAVNWANKTLSAIK